MFKRARHHRYIELLGLEAGQAFIGLEKLCFRRWGGRKMVETFLNRVLDVEPDYRLQAVLYLSAPFELQTIQEKAVTQITTKNQYEFMVRDCRTRLANPTLGPTDRAKLERELKGLEAEAKHWNAAIEALTEHAEEKMAKYADFERRYRESLGAWPQKRSRTNSEPPA